MYFWPKIGKIGKNFFCSKSAEMKILLCKVGMGNKPYEIKFFELCSKKFELIKQIHLLKIGFVIFLKGATFLDFIDLGLLNYIPSAIQICIPLFWGIFFPLGSSLVKLWVANNKCMKHVNMTFLKFFKKCAICFCSKTVEIDFLL